MAKGRQAFRRLFDLSRQPVCANGATVPAALRKMAIAGLRYWPVSDEKISFEYKLKPVPAGILAAPGRWTHFLERYVSGGKTGPFP